MIAGGAQAVPDDPGPQVLRHPGPGPRPPDHLRVRAGGQQLLQGRRDHRKHGERGGGALRAHQGAGQDERIKLACKSTSLCLAYLSDLTLFIPTFLLGEVLYLILGGGCGV